MLVLTRKQGEQIRIGRDIKIRVLELAKGVVKLGIEAPESIPVYREEIFEMVKKANLAAKEDALIQSLDTALDMWKARMKKQ